MRIVDAKSPEYTKAVDRIKNLGGRLTHNKLAAYLKLCGASEVKVRAAFKLGLDPKLSFQPLGFGLDGQNHPLTRQLEINYILAKAFNKELMTAEQLDKVVEHEVAHWFYRTWIEETRPLRPIREIGDAYETAVYGKVERAPWNKIRKELYGGKIP